MASGTKINIDLVLNTKGFRPLGRINGQLGEFEKSLDASNARVLAFGASAGAILAVKKAFTATVSAMIEVERSLQDINVILNTSTSSLKKFGSDLFAIASLTGQSFKVAAEAATELSRQGLGLEETLKRTKDALILARLSGMGAAEAVMSLTAALNTFNQVGLDSTAIINKLANVDAAFAVSSDDLAKALGRVGASAKGAGVSLDELLAIVTTAQQKTARGGAVIGNSFKTIFTRIQRPRVIGQLEELGIRVKDLQGATLPALKVLSNLARQFDNLTQSQQAQISELVGGVFQVNILKAAMADLSSEQSIYNSALKISAGSTDEAIQRNTRLNETLSAQFNRTVNSFKEGAAELGTLTLEPALRNLLNVGDAIADASKSEASLGKAGQFIGRTLFGAIGKFMAGPGLLIIGFTLFKTFKQLGRFAGDAFKTLTGLNKNFQNQLNLQRQIFDVLSENPDLMAKIKNGTISVEDAHKEIFDQIEKNTGALDKQLLVSRQLAESLTAGGIGISPEFGATKGKKPRTFGSHGYIPNFAGDPEEVLGMARGGYSRSQLRNARTRKERLHDGRGGSQMATVNGHESVFTGRNKGGHKATFVVPPKGTDAYKQYMSSLSGGFVPSFMAYARLKKGKDFNANRPGEGKMLGLGQASFTGEGEDKVFKALGDRRGTTLMLKDGTAVVSDKPLHGMAAMDAGIDPRKIVGGGFHNVHRGQLSFGESDMTDISELGKVLSSGFIPNFNKALLEKLVNLSKLKKDGAFLPGVKTDFFNTAKQIGVDPELSIFKGSGTAQNPKGQITNVLAKAKDIVRRQSDPDYAELGGGKALYGAGGDIGKWKKDGKSLVLDSKGKYGVLGLYGGTTDKGFAYADVSKIPNLGKNATNPNLRNKTLHGGIERVGIANMQFRSLAGAISEKGSDWEQQSGTKFTQLVRKHYAKPTHNLAKDTAKAWQLGGKTKIRPSQIGETGTRLFGVSAEGEIFETVANAITQGAGAGGSFEKALKGDTQQSWDFPNTGKKFRGIYNFGSQLKMADAKRSLSKEAMESVVNKVFSTGAAGSTMPKHVTQWKSAKKSAGYIPNFNALFEAVRRERDAGVSEGKIRVGRDGSLTSSKNPLGFGVYNTGDEPRGLSQGVNRERRGGRDPKRSGASWGYVPNYAPAGGKGGGMFESGMAKLAGGIFGLQLAFSTAEQALGENTAAIHVLKSVEKSLIVSSALLLGAYKILKKSNLAIVVSNERLRKSRGGRAGGETRESKLSDVFTKKGRADIGSKFRAGRSRERERASSELFVEGNVFSRAGDRLSRRASRRSAFGGRTRDKGGRFKKAGAGRLLATRGMAAAGGALAGAGGAIGGLAAVAGPVSMGLAALGAVAFSAAKMIDGVNQAFKLRDLRRANKSFQSISKKNEQISNDLSNYSKSLQQFKTTLSKGDASVAAVMGGLAALNASLSKMAPDMRRKFQTVFDPRAASTLLGEEQERIAQQNKRGQNRVRSATMTSELGEKEGLMNTFALQFSGLGFGEKINEESTDLDYKNLAQSILTSDENVDFAKTMAGKTGAERGEIMSALGSGDAKKIAATMRALGFGEETIISFSDTMNRSGTSGDRLSEALANNAIETNRANIEMAIMAPIIKIFAEQTTKANKEIFKMQRALEVERSIMKEVGSVMQKGANLFLGEVGKIDLQAKLSTNLLKGDKAEKVSKAGRQLTKAFSNQTDVEHLQRAFGITGPGGEATAAGKAEAAKFQTDVGTAREKLQNMDQTIAAEGKAEMDALGTKLTDMMKTEGQTKTVNALNRLNSEMVNLTTVEEGAARELKEQTEKITRVAEAQKQLVEIQRQIGEAGGVKFEGLGEGLKKIATADLLGRVAKQSGSRVGAARFDAQKFDAIQKLQGGQGTLNKVQLEKAREAARIQGEAAYTAMRNTGQFKDEMFKEGRPGAAIGRKGAARFKSDDFKDASKDVQDTLERSEGDLKSVLDQMQAIATKSNEQEAKVLKQIEVLASATGQLQVATDKMVEQQKIVFEQGQVKMKGGMWGAGNPAVQMKYVYDLIDRSVTKGAAAAKTELVVRLDIPGLEELAPGSTAKVNKSIDLAMRKANEAKKVIVDGREIVGDVWRGT